MTLRLALAGKARCDGNAEMKILILGLNYLPETTSIGPYTAELAEYLREQGHAVSVITSFPAAPHWKIWEGYRGKKLMREVLNGIPILRTYLYVPKNPRSTVRRLLSDFSFSISALMGIFSGRPDLVVVISPPLQLVFTAILLTFGTSRVFLQIKDLVPDAAVAVGAFKQGSLILKAAYAFERFAYKNADGIGVICDGMRRNLLSKGVPPNKVLLLPDYIDTHSIRPADRNNAFRERFQIPGDEFLAVYSGSVGGKQGLQTFVEAASLLEQENGITCCLIGDGPYLPELRSLADRVGAKRLRFLPLQPREALSQQLSAADALVITQRASITDMVFPGKLLYYMASGRPIVAAVAGDSETGRFIRNTNVGVVVPPEDAAGLANAFRQLRTNPQQARQLGSNGRDVAVSQFDRSVVLERFGKHLAGAGQAAI